jgi:cysteine desulfurase / selenocysteine lyase
MTEKPIDLARARRETPGCAHVLHFNNAGASLMPQPVIDAVMNYWQREAVTGGYETARETQEQLQNVYHSIARLINARAEEIALVESATYAWNAAFRSIRFQPGDHILTSVAEYASNYIGLLQTARQYGLHIEVIPNDEHGQVSVEALTRMINRRTRLIAITHVPTNGGLVNPAAEIGRIARQADILYLLDACQSVGQYPVDVAAIGCDMLSATGRKYLRAPRGTGFLYVRKERIEPLEPPFLDLHSASWPSQHSYTIRPDARRFEMFESSLAAKMGLGAAVDYLLEWGIAPVWTRIQYLAQLLRNQLAEVPGVQVHDLGVEKCGIVTFTVAGKTAGEMQSALHQRRINVSVSSRESTRIDMEARQLTQLIRASVHYYNSEEEITALVESVRELGR